MERNKGTRKTLAKQRRRAVIEWIVTRLAIIVVLIACAISVITTQAALLEKRQEEEELLKAIEIAKEENLELTNFSKSGDLAGYMERTAIEDFNYAYPNERRFYDTSRD